MEHTSSHIQNNSEAPQGSTASDRTGDRNGGPRGRRRRRRRGLTVVAALVSLAVVGVLIAVSVRSGSVAAQENGGAGVPERSETVRRIPVRVIETTRRDFVEYGEYFGEARGISRAVLSAGAGGRVSAIHADEGDRVNAGDSLAEIDIRRAETRYRTAVLAEKLARENYEREQRFLQEGNSFQLKVDQAQLDWLQAQNRLHDAERMYEDARAITPISGIVLARHFERNDDLEAGDITFEVADLSRLKVAVGVPEADIAGVRELNRAEVRFGSFPDTPFAGLPTSFSRSRSERTLTYRVDIEIDNPDEVVLAGQTARVRLELRRHPDVVVVPNRAVFNRNDRTYVMIVEDDIAREVAVTAGVSDNSGTVIRRGLEGGELLVADGFNRLGDGSPVSIQE